MSVVNISPRVQRMFDNFQLDSEYAEYIMNNSNGERVICNGDTLTIAMEDGYLSEEFLLDYQSKL
jgi:hypothetical protein